MKPLAETDSFHCDSVGGDEIWIEEKEGGEKLSSRTDEEMTALECGWFSICSVCYRARGNLV